MYIAFTSSSGHSAADLTAEKAIKRTRQQTFCISLYIVIHSANEVKEYWLVMCV